MSANKRLIEQYQNKASELRGRKQTIDTQLDLISELIDELKGKPTVKNRNG